MRERAHALPRWTVIFTASLLLVAAPDAAWQAEAQTLTRDEDVARRLSPGRGAELTEGDAFRQLVLADSTWTGWHAFTFATPDRRPEGGELWWHSAREDRASIPKLRHRPPDTWLPPVVLQLAELELDGCKVALEFVYALAFDWDDDGLRELILVARFLAFYNNEFWDEFSDLPEVWVFADFPEDPSDSPTLRYYARTGDELFEPVAGRELRWQDVDGDGTEDLIFGVEGHYPHSCDADSPGLDIPPISNHVALLSPAEQPHLIGLGAESLWRDWSGYLCHTNERWLSSVETGASIYLSQTRGHAPIDGSSARWWVLGLGPFEVRYFSFLPIRSEAVADTNHLLSHSEEGSTFRLPTTPEAAHSVEPWDAWVVVLGQGDGTVLRGLRDTLLPLVPEQTVGDVQVGPDEHVLVLPHAAQPCLREPGTDTRQLFAEPRYEHVIESAVVYGAFHSVSAAEAAGGELLQALPEGHSARAFTPWVARLEDVLLTTVRRPGLDGRSHGSSPQVEPDLPSCSDLEGSSSAMQPSEPSDE